MYAIKHLFRRLITLTKKEKGEILFLFFWLSFYLFFQSKSIYGGDAGDLVTAAITRGIPHPPGYPLYTFLASLLIYLPIPIYTIAWRVSLLSSLSSAFTLTILFIIIKKITKNTTTALISVFFLGFNYLFWLYSIVPEVFSLNNLFGVLLIYLVWAIRETKNLNKLKIYLWFFALILGLVVCHHHTLIFIFPGLIYLIRNKKVMLKKISYFSWLKIGSGLLIGLSPLVYLPAASNAWPALDWGHPVSLNNFLRLIFRSDYGTFRSSVNLGNQPILRLGSLAAFGSFILKDFWLLGVIFIIFGLIYLRQKARDIFWFILINLVALAFFLFYASFILFNDFMVATFERFLLLPYMFLTVLLGCGLTYIFHICQKIFKQKFMIMIIMALFFLYPLSNFYSNYKNLISLRDDLTAEFLAKDILDSLPQNSILLLSSDTTLFNTQYYYYAFKYRTDIKLIHLFKLTQDYYYKNLKKYYPDLSLNIEEDQSQRINSFISQNKNHFPIFTTVDGEKVSEDFIWLSQGLLMQYFPSNEATPSANILLQKNQQLWQTYNDPLSGSLGKYKNLFLADVLRIYKEAHKKTGELFLEHQYYNEAQKHFEQMIRLNPKDTDGYISLGKTFLAQKDCINAEANLQKALVINDKDVYALAYLRKVYLDCFQDQQKAKTFENACLEQEQQGQPNLKDL